MKTPTAPHLWFTQNNATEAMNYYCSVFPNSRILSIERYPDESLDEHFRGMSGKVIAGQFELNGTLFLAIDGGEQGFDFNSAISFVVECDDQAEIDHFWQALSAVPEDEQCGWCTDQFGLRWQVIPRNMDDLLKTSAQIKAMLAMKKIDIQALVDAG